MTLQPPHAFLTEKPEELDRDRFIPLTAEVANLFAEKMNERFLNAPPCWLTDNRAALLRESINQSKVFPFMAEQNEQAKVWLRYHPEKVFEAKLKNLSNGVNDIYGSFVRALLRQSDAPIESVKIGFSKCFESALLAAYEKAGMPEGAHTKYVGRGC